MMIYDCNIHTGKIMGGAVTQVQAICYMNWRQLIYKDIDHIHPEI
jgi:hypothetical protein